MIFARFLFVATILFNCLRVVAQEQDALSDFQHNRETLGIKGKVKTITCMNYKMGNQYQLKFNEMFDNYVFDKTGNVKVQEEFIQYGNFHGRKKYSYNKENYISALSSYSRDSSMEYSHTYNYDGLKKVTLTEKKSNGEVNAILYYYFDEHGNRTRLEFGQGRSNANEFSYDNKNRIVINKTFFGLEKEPSFTKNITYMENMREDKTLNGQGAVYRIETSTFSNEGNKTKNSLLYPNEGKEMEIVETFDRFGNVTSHTLIEKGEKTPESSYICEYEYDVTGNWIKRAMYKTDGTINSEIERKLTYFAE
jgi:hypothetical protein